MTISDLAIRRPVLTTMVSLALIVLGVLAASRLRTDMWPSVTIPFCTVTTVYPGASPQDIEAQVTRPLEEAVAGIPGIERLFSQTRENVSLVFVQFKMSVPVAEGVQRVRDRVGMARGALPRHIDAPVIAEFDVAAQPIVVFSASTPDVKDAGDLRYLVEKQLRPRLEQIPGVATARILGGGTQEIAVDLNPQRLDLIHMPVEMVLNRIRGDNITLPAGHFEADTQQVGVRVLGDFQDLRSLRDMVVITAPDGRQARLSDIARIHEQEAETSTSVRTNGRAALAVEVVKQSGANTVAVAEAVRAELQNAQKRLEGRLHTDVIVDQSQDIRANTHEVWLAIYFGGAMAILIILFFLLDVRGTVISALALPTSVVGTLLVMWWLDFSLNQITLMSLSLAIGLLIDDAVVVRESITRRLEMGDDPATAASVGTREVALAVMATTLTLCAVFIPVAFMQGIVAQFFRQFGLTMTIAVLLSLFVAFTLDPMLSAQWTRRHRKERQRGVLVRGIEGLLARLDGAYARSLHWVLQHRKTVCAGAVLLLAFSLWVGSRLGVEFIDAVDRGQLNVAMEFLPGTRGVTVAERSAVAEAKALALPGVETVYAVLGPEGEAEKVRMRVVLADKANRPHPLGFYKDALRGILAEVPQAKAVVSDPPMMEGVGDWPPIWVQIMGPDLTELRQHAEFVADTLRALPGAVDVRLLDNPGKPELALQVDKEKAGKLNLPAGAIAMQVRMATLGEVAGKLHHDGRDLDIRVRLTAQGRNSPEALGRLTLWTPEGKSVALADVTTQQMAVGPALIEHEMRERQISVMAQIGAGHSLGGVSKALRDKLAAKPLPEGYSLAYNGQQKDMHDMLASMFLALGLALVFIYMVLASQFESLLHPLTIMLALPLALVGAVLALAVTGNPLGLGAAIGIILLMGLVTKNAILLVDGALVHVRAGDSPMRAMAQAGPRRLRPILMTSAAMMLGMLPTALGRGAGSEFRSPMALSVMGGVLTSTLLTLWVVPVVFVWFERGRGRTSAVRQHAAAPPLGDNGELARTVV